MFCSWCLDLIFSPANLRGRLADRYQRLPHAQYICAFKKKRGQKFAPRRPKTSKFRWDFRQIRDLIANTRISQKRNRMSSKTALQPIRLCVPNLLKIKCGENNLFHHHIIISYLKFIVPPLHYKRPWMGALHSPYIKVRSWGDFMQQC